MRCLRMHWHNRMLNWVSVGCLCNESLNSLADLRKKHYRLLCTADEGDEHDESDKELKTTACILRKLQRKAAPRMRVAGFRTAIFGWVQLFQRLVRTTKHEVGCFTEAPR